MPPCVSRLVLPDCGPALGAPGDWFEPADCAQAGRMEHSASLTTAALSSRQWHPAPVYTVGSAPKSRTVEELPRAPANSQSYLALDP